MKTSIYLLIDEFLTRHCPGFFAVKYRRDQSGPNSELAVRSKTY